MERGFIVVAVNDVWFGPAEARDTSTDCRVYWGSHGCHLPRGHDGPHTCDCAYDEEGNLLPRDNYDNYDKDGHWLNVGAPPYYGPETSFYGEDAEALGLPLVSPSPSDGP